MVTLLAYNYSLNAASDAMATSASTAPATAAAACHRHRPDQYRTWTSADLEEHGAMMIGSPHARLGGLLRSDLVRLCEVYSIWGASESLDATRPLMPARIALHRPPRRGPAGEGLAAGFIAASDDHAGQRARRAGCGCPLSRWPRCRLGGVDPRGDLGRALEPPLLRHHGRADRAGVRGGWRADEVRGGRASSPGSGRGPGEAVPPWVLRGAGDLRPHGHGLSPLYADRPRGPRRWRVHYARVMADREMAWSSPVWV